MNSGYIDKQIEKEPLTKEESRKQFVEQTEKLGLKHSFNFDEAWEIGEQLRKRKDFRERITDLEKQVTNFEGVIVGEEMEKTNPVKHSFADGCYIREIFNPANELIITKIHKKEHPFFLMEGKMSILTENGIKHIEAPYHGITKPGTKRAIYTHTDCVFVTVHATENTDIQKIEEEVIAKDFNDPEITLEDIKLLKNIN
tara:strand:+ start:373 stop:969 length:597 start_codon:yes stop_codon:yes gene_type:complete